jgi:DNA-directed RNA polymerase specialized sigma24 family protein
VTDPDRLAADHYRTIFYVLRRWFPRLLRRGVAVDLGWGRFDPLDFGWRELLAAARWYVPGEGRTFVGWATKCLRLAFLRYSGQCRRWRRSEARAGQAWAARRAAGPPHPSLALDLAAAVGSLDAADRDLFGRWEAADYSASELARREGVPLRTMQQRVQRVRNRLRTRLSGYDGG